MSIASSLHICRVWKSFSITSLRFLWLTSLSYTFQFIIHAFSPNHSHPFLKDVHTILTCPVTSYFQELSQNALLSVRLLYTLQTRLPTRRFFLRYRRYINQAYSEYKHVLANILHSRYVARTPPLEARSPGRRGNVENASVTRRSLISNVRTPRVN